MGNCYVCLLEYLVLGNCFFVLGFGLGSGYIELMV